MGCGNRSETLMKWIMVAACAAAISLALAPTADAKGCIKGALVGGVAGHMAGHGKLGAAAVSSIIFRPEGDCFV